MSVAENNLLCGFKIGDDHYAIPVLEIQEVVKPQQLTKVPLAPEYVDGLINLRGQIVTAINMRVLFGLGKSEKTDHMNVIIKGEDSLYSLVVDEVHDVIEVYEKDFEKTPDTVDPSIKKFINGVYKLDKKLLTLIDLEKIVNIRKNNLNEME